MKTFFTILLAAICVAGFSQKKPKINQALSAMEDGNLAEAKSIIDLAIEHEKTMGDAKTWFYRGQIYAALDTANNEPGALEESMKAYDKALALDPDQKATSSVDFSTGAIVNVDSKRQEIYGYYYNQAITAYNGQEYAKATEDFETAYYIVPTDTNAMLNAAYAALADENDDRAKKNFNSALEAGSSDKNIYLQLYNFAVTAENYEEGLDAIQRGREAYPEDVDFMKYEINLYLQLDKVDEARTGLEEAIAADPNSADLYFSLGVLKEETEDIDGAIESYQKALGVDPDHFNANFNMAVYVFNKANELLKQRNALSYKEERKINELTKQINAQLEESKPLWEKLYDLKSTDVTVLETLGFIYTNLKLNDQAMKIMDELDAVKDN